MMLSGGHIVDSYPTLELTDAAPCAHTSPAGASCPLVRRPVFGYLSEGTSMRVATKYLAVLIVVLLVPTAAFAQGSFTGVVRDSSGGVLPGVMVEAASPVLIEKVRS